MSRTKRVLTPKEKALIYVNMKKKVPLRETAAMFGVSYPTMQKWTNEAWVDELDIAVEAFVHSYLCRDEIEAFVAEKMT
ncbi:MAG: hypothetical protein OXI43_12630 [Candidatus Poribacteria bacterium]|nr:hypothetical protein [Candidatus Poribacteria bacterium]